MKSVFLFTLACVPLVADQIPPFFMDTVVALGRMDSKAVGQPPEWTTEASGFLYGYLVKDDLEPTKRSYELYLITNRHVLANHASILLRFNPEKAEAQAKQFPLALKDEKGQEVWFSLPESKIDISVVQLNAQYMHEQSVKSSFFASDLHTADKAKMNNIGLAAGDGVFVLGFPMGISGAQRNYVIARRGSIARISDLLDSIDDTFLIDALVFPGNSGGPVISAVSSTAISGTKLQNAAFLIGVVRAYLPYNDVAVSAQTGQVRAIFQENSGLAEVIPIDYVNDTIRAWHEARDKRSAPAQR